MFYGANIRALRKTKKLTQAQLGELLKVRSTTVSNWEKESAEPSFSVLFQLASFFGVDPGEILTKDLSGDQNTNKSGNEVPLPEIQNKQKSSNAAALPKNEPEKKTQEVKQQLNPETKSTDRDNLIDNLIDNPIDNLRDNPLFAELQKAKEKIQELETQLRNCQEQGAALQQRFEQSIEQRGELKGEIKFMERTLTELRSLVEQRKAETDMALVAKTEAEEQYKELQYQASEMYNRLQKYNDTDGLQANIA